MTLLDSAVLLAGVVLGRASVARPLVAAWRLGGRLADRRAAA